MDFDLPFTLEIAAPSGDTATSAAGPVTDYLVTVEETPDGLTVELERRFSTGSGTGIARQMGRADTGADDWPEFAPQLIVQVVQHFAEHPTLHTGFAFVLGRPDVIAK